MNYTRVMTQLDESRVPLHWLECGADLTWLTKPWSWRPRSSVIKISGISQGFGTLMDHGFHLYMRRISMRPLVPPQANLFLLLWNEMISVWLSSSVPFLAFSLWNILQSASVCPERERTDKNRKYTAHTCQVRHLIIEQTSYFWTGVHARTHKHLYTHWHRQTHTHTQCGTAFSYLSLFCVLFLLPFIQWITRTYSLTHLNTHKNCFPKLFNIYMQQG